MKAIPLLAKRNPGLARARCVERADSFARAVPWRVPGSVLCDRPGGRPLAFAVLPALAIQSLPFPAKRNGGGSFVMVSVAGSPRPHSTPPNPPPFRLAALHYRTPHTFPNPTTVTSKQNIYWPNGTSDSQGHAVSKELIFFARAPHIEKATLPPGQTISEKRTLSPGQTISKERSLSPGQFTGEFQFPFCKTSLAGDPLPLRFFLPSRFSASLFRQNGMAVGLSLWR